MSVHVNDETMKLKVGIISLNMHLQGSAEDGAAAYSSGQQSPSPGRHAASLVARPTRGLKRPMHRVRGL